MAASGSNVVRGIPMSLLLSKVDCMLRLGMPEQLQKAS
jgi:hypothetical protein